MASRVQRDACTPRWTVAGIPVTQRAEHPYHPMISATCLISLSCRLSKLHLRLKGGCNTF